MKVSYMAKAGKTSEKKEKTSRIGAKRVSEEKKVRKSPKKAGAQREIATAASVVPNSEKLQVIEAYQVKPGDTGSPEVQVALLTKRTEKLVSHLKHNPSDNHSRRGLLGIISKRRRLLNYLEKKDKKRYGEILKKVGLSK